MNHAHVIKIKFVGPSNYKPARYKVSWGNWPSAEKRSYSFYIPFDYALTCDQQYRAVADTFLKWLNDGMDSDTHDAVIESLTTGTMNSDTDVMLVQTRWERR